MGYEKRQFLYGMDLDTEERLIEPGFSRKNVNVRIGSSTDSGVYSAENIQGNTFIPNTELPSGTNKVIGSCWDKLRDLSYYFLYNSEGNHGIFEYNHVEGKIVKVMIASVLNFQSEELITGHNVIEFDENNNLLYFTDGFNPPRKINIQKAKAGFYAEPIKEEVVDAIKYPPLKPPTFKFELDQNQLVNHLINKIVQFKAAYVYDDQEESAYSPISTQAIPKDNNVIKVTIPKGGELVKRVIVAFRFGNTGDFLQAEDKDVSKYDTDSNGDYLYEFRNEKNYNSISLPKSNKLFDSLPQLAQAQEYIEGNRISYGNITEGYDNVAVELDLKVDYEEEFSTNSNTIKGFLRISNSNNEDNFNRYQPITCSTSNDPSTYAFGGFGKSNAIEPAAMISGLKQQIPLGGFVIYLAGTDYYCISRQVSEGGSQNDSASRLQDNNNVYLYQTNKHRKMIKGAIEGQGGGNTLYPETRVYSTWEMNDVPDGTYLMRVASNWTTQEDLLDPDRKYQKTSTFLNRIGEGRTTSDVQMYYDKEYKVVVKNGEVLDNIEIVVADLSGTAVFAQNTPINNAGYVCDFVTLDPFSTYIPNSISGALGQKRIDLCEVQYSSRDGRFSNLTDHNGFFFNSPNRSSTITSIQSGLQRQEINNDAYDLLGPATGSPLPSLAPFNTSIGTTRFWIIPNKNQDLTSKYRTNFEIRILDKFGNPQEGVDVVCEQGDVQKTQSNGIASLILYAPSANFFGSPSLVDRKLGFIPMLKNDVFGSYSPESLGENFIPIFIGVNGFQNENSLLFDIAFNAASDPNKSRLKNGGTYSFGLVYYDRANRSGTTNFAKDLSLPFYSNNVKTAPSVEWEITSEPPSWATHYQIVRTLNTELNKYIQWFTSDVSYSGGLNNNFNDAPIIEFDITNLTDEYKTSNPDSVLVYDFTTGDRMRLIKDSSNNYYEDYIDLKILSFEAGILKVKNDAQDKDLSSGAFFEIYTPKLDVDQYIYYEIGECYDILKAVDPVSGDTISYHQGRTKDQDPFNLSDGAKGFLIGGDTYYRSRSISTETSGFYRTSIDSQLVSDFFQSKVSDIGRPNIVDANAHRVNRITSIYYSDRFIPETNINGLNSFFDTAFETYDRKYGSIQKLFSQDKRLDCYQETKTGKILVEENVIFDQFDQGTVASSAKVLSKIIYYRGDYGTLNPESFVENEGRRYWFDVRNGKVLRLSNDGITPLSDKKMHAYFESKSNFYSAFNLLPEVWGVFDENFDEYIVAFGSVSRPEGFTPDELALVSSQADQITETRDGLTFTFDILYTANPQGVPTEFEVVRDLSNGTFVINSVAGDISLDRQKLLTIPAETLAFSEKTGHWTSFYSYAPECMVRIGIDFLSFRNGQAYLHNTPGAKRNSFYGEERGSEVWAVFNQNPSNVKVFQALSEESDSVWQVRDIFTQGGQRSNLNKDDFSVAYGQGHTLYSKENIHYAPIWKDENTPNVENPLIEGDSMRDVSILFKLINDSTNEERLFAVSMNYSLSERSNR
tara:strand:- start:107 stop:4648 length:4542 start_codon:yes stop_codon:yes gene_type:complete